MAIEVNYDLTPKKAGHEANKDLTMSKPRRHFTPDFKLRCVLNIVSGRKHPIEICREYNISASLLTKWRQHFTDNAVKLFDTGQKQNHADANRIV